MLINIIAGARPNFMKIAPVIAAIRQAQKRAVRILRTVLFIPGSILIKI